MKVHKIYIPWIVNERLFCKRSKLTRIHCTITAKLCTFLNWKCIKKFVMSQPVLPLSSPNVQKSRAVYKNVKKDCFAV